MATIKPDGTTVVQRDSRPRHRHLHGDGQVAADALGMPIAKVRFELGDTRCPEAPLSGGSRTVASVGPAVTRAARGARDQLIAIALGDTASPLHRLNANDVDNANGWLFAASDPRRGVAITVLRASSRAGDPRGSQRRSGRPERCETMQAFGAVSVEVHVDPDLGTVRVLRIVASTAWGGC